MKYHYKYHSLLLVAFIWKNPNSRYWQAGFTNEHGKRKNASTGIDKLERHRIKALRIADEYERVAQK
ncbi:hypothetical protein [Rubritalea sp.]|uniref:hypothetical protein n=1 Tax=Rubritalea sp. TaxID=2109375 RepID=UPI003EFAADF4